MRLPNQTRVRAVVSVLLLCCCPLCFGTALVVLISGNAIVFGADGLNQTTLGNNSTPIPNGTATKVLILDSRFIISSTGVGSTRSYVFADLVKSLPVKSSSSVRGVAQMLSAKCWPIFLKLWPSLSLVPSNLANDHSLPLVTYFVGGYEFRGPELYSVKIFIDWKTHRLRQPAVAKEYPMSPELIKQLMTKGPIYHNIIRS